MAQVSLEYGAFVGRVGKLDLNAQIIVGDTVQNDWDTI
jgi:hypothetical protein